MDQKSNIKGIVVRRSPTGNASSDIYVVGQVAATGEGRESKVIAIIPGAYSEFVVYFEDATYLLFTNQIITAWGEVIE